VRALLEQPELDHLPVHLERGALVYFRHVTAFVSRGW
jgi:hypothetical protein